MNATIYSISKLVKSYNGRRILAIDELEIRRGEIFGVVGPSGAGKSTLLRLLNFLERPTEGEVLFEGATFCAHREMPLKHRRQVSTVSQRPVLLNRTVAANVAFGLALRGRRKSTQLVKRALEQVGLNTLARQHARTLSGGEAQRVALARAMVLRPDVLLLDEPTANLDPFNVGIIEQTVAGLNKERGTTMILVTHNIFQARRLAHRVALLLDGKMVEVNDVDEFFNAPRDPRTAAFVRGDMIY